MSPPTKRGPEPLSPGPNDPGPISKAEESYRDGSTWAEPKGRCAAVTASGRRCRNRAKIGPVCLIHEEHNDQLPYRIRRAVRRARKHKLAKWLRQRASNPPLLSSDELELLVEHAEHGAHEAAEYIGRLEYDDIALDVQRRGFIRDRIVDGLYRIQRERRERSGMLRLVTGGAR